MDIELSYIGIDGKTHSIPFDKNSREVRLTNKKITKIDLTPLSNFTKLNNLSLYGNKIKNIDLTPLRHCTQLRSINLGGNLLKTIDLTPLSSCSKFKILELRENKLTEIDLSSLSSCTKLDSIYLYENRLKSIDLSPLSSCTSFSILWLNNNRIENIDLTPLGSCKNLIDLSLEYNKLKSVNLSPLSSCAYLSELSLCKNQIHEITLNPLSSCKKLERLILSYNRIHSIDLTPLGLCSSLNELHISENKIEQIDLTPLSSCTKLEFLNLDSNLIGNIDITPLCLSDNFKKIRLHLNPLKYIEIFLSKKMTEYYVWDYPYVYFDRPLPLNSFDLLERLVPIVREWEDPWKMYHIAQEALRLHGLHHFGLIDVNPSQYLSLALDGSNRENLEQCIIEFLFKQIKNKGTSIGLDLQSLAGYEKLSQHMDTVVRLRKEELSKVTIKEERFWYDLRMVALTYHGFQLLIETGLDLSIDKADFTKLQESYAKLGIELKVTKNNFDLDILHISENMREYIWALVEFHILQ